MQFADDGDDSTDGPDTAFWLAAVSQSIKKGRLGLDLVLIQSDSVYSSNLT